MDKREVGDVSGYSKFEPGFIIFLGDAECSICETMVINETVVIK